MNYALAFDAVEKILSHMMEASAVDRIIGYTSIKTIVDDVEKYARENNKNTGYAAEKFASLLWSSASIAKIDDGNGKPDQMHYSWATSALDSLRSAACFDIHNSGDA